MTIKNFCQLEEIVQGREPSRIAVVSAEDEKVLTAIKLAFRKGIIHDPILVGDAQKIEKILLDLKESITDYQIENAPNSFAAAQIAIKFINDGAAHILAKGNIKTNIFLKAILDKEHGIKVSPILSNLTLFELNSYHKFIGITDIAIIPEPGLKEKIDIVNNSYPMWYALGVVKPKVAVLAAVEVVNPNMQTTVDAACLAKMAERNQIENFIIDGPLSYDVAMNTEFARDKGIYNSRVAGDPDMLLVPGLEAGNILGKSLKIHGKAKSGAIVFGAKVPVMINSRSDSAERRFYSILLAKVIAENKKLCFKSIGKV